MTASESTRKLHKYLSSQNLYTSVRLTAAALIPAFVLYHLGLLQIAIALPLGAMFTGLMDSPGPIHHRRNCLMVSIGFNFFIILIAGALHNYTPLVVTAIVFFGMFLSLISVYGTRAGSIGLNALIVFIFNIDGHMLANGTALHEALLFAAGGAWYMVLSLLLYVIRPYKLMEQVMGECLIQIADYLRVKGSFYGSSPQYNVLSDELIQYQITIRQTQDDLREMLFKTRSVVQESTVKGRVLMSMFLDSIDLMERIMTSQFDYEELHQKFGDTEILGVIEKQVFALSGELHDVGLALQSGFQAKTTRNLDILQQETMNAFLELRNKKLNEKTVEDFIILRQILYSLQDVTERIKRLRVSSCFDVKISKVEKPDIDIEQFISHNEIDPRLLLTNISINSSAFRHAIRLTVALLVGYSVSFFFPVVHNYSIGHSYWILLTIAVIIKPAYSITRKRNIHRLLGTITGAILGFGILYFIHDTTALFILMTGTMVISYSFLKVNYFVSSAGITLYVLISFSFLSSSGFQHALNDRVLDTLIGSAIAWLAALFLLPDWEHQRIDEDIAKALTANRQYFDTVAQSFLGQPADATTFKLHRKDAFVALANLSDTFQRMLSEPKNNSEKLSHYHQFVSTNHLLSSYIASLSYYAQRAAGKYVSPDFQPLITQIDQHFEIAEDVLQHHQTTKASQVKPVMANGPRIQELLQQRRREIEAGKSEMETPVRRTLSDLKTINDQFEMISTATVDEVRILEKIAE